MAQNQDIVATNEQLERIVMDFAAELEAYIKTMENEISKLNASVSALEEGWSASAYEAFRDKMAERTGIIQSEINEARKLVEFLHDRAADYRLMMELFGGASK